MQMKMPYVTEAHVGFLAPQSKHALLPDIWRRRLSTASVSALVGSCPVDIS